MELFLFSVACKSCFDVEDEGCYNLGQHYSCWYGDLLEYILPSLGTDFAPTIPPWSSVSSLDMNNPNPDPPYYKIVNTAKLRYWSGRSWLTLI